MVCASACPLGFSAHVETRYAPMTTNDIRELEYQTDNIAILRVEFKVLSTTSPLIRAGLRARIIMHS